MLSYQPRLVYSLPNLCCLHSLAPNLNLMEDFKADFSTLTLENCYLKLIQGLTACLKNHFCFMGYRYCSRIRPHIGQEILKILSRVDSAYHLTFANRFQRVIMAFWGL